MGLLHLTLRQLQIFVAVARSGSTSAASADIALSQSAVSAAVLELERLLSVTLFDRTGKRLVLNANGRALLPRAQALLEGAHAIERIAQETGTQLQSLRIGASTTIGSHVVPRLLSRLLGTAPAAAESWQSMVTIGNTAEICARVAAFELDVGLIEGTSHEAALQVHPWVRDEMVVVGSALKGRPAARMGVRDLRDAVWLLREPDPAPARRWTRPCCRTCTRTGAPSSWEAPKPSSMRPVKDWGSRSSRAGWSPTGWPREGWSNSRPRCRPSCGSATGSFTATSS